eukprot:4971848-Amphidinium_carterae.1
MPSSRAGFARTTIVCPFSRPRPGSEKSKSIPFCAEPSALQRDCWATPLLDMRMFSNTCCRLVPVLVHGADRPGEVVRLRNKEYNMLNMLLITLSDMHEKFTVSRPKSTIDRVRQGKD